MAEKTSNFLDELSNGLRCHRDKVNFDTNIIYEDSLLVLEYHLVKKNGEVELCNFSK